MTKKRAKQGPALDEALKCCEEDVMSLAGVSGVALGEADGRPCVVVYVERLTPALRARIPEQYAGVPVKIEVSGRFEAR